MTAGSSSSQPPGAVDGAPTSRIGQSCVFCGTRDVAWVHPLHPERVTYSKHGTGHTLPTSWSLCEACERVVQAGDDDAVVTLMRASETWGPTWIADEDVAEEVGQLLAVFRHADLGARRFAPDPPALVDAIGQRFVPLDDLTGVAHALGPLWPTAHRRRLDQRSPSGEPGLWLVRSPWPSLSLDDAMGLLWRWVERAPFPEENAAWAARVVDVLGWSEGEAVAFARTVP